MNIDPGFPCVVKIGGCHAGHGKIRVPDRTTWSDVKSIVALHTDYATAEPFIEYDYEIRLQKIGGHYRALKRLSSGWKGNTSVLSTEEVEMTDEWRSWISEASSIFGGLDICALDVVHRASDGAMFILELNDTAIGLCNACEADDHALIRDLVLARLTEPAAAPAASTDAAEPGAAGAGSSPASAAAEPVHTAAVAVDEHLASRMAVSAALAARDKAEAEVKLLREQLLVATQQRAGSWLPWKR